MTTHHDQLGIYDQITLQVYFLSHNMSALLHIIFFIHTHLTYKYACILEVIAKIILT